MKAFESLRNIEKTGTVKIAHSSARLSCTSNVIGILCFPRRTLTLTKSSIHNSVSLPNVLKLTGIFLITLRLSLLTISGLMKLRCEPVSKKALTLTCLSQYLTFKVAVGKTLLGNLVELTLVT